MRLDSISSQITSELKKVEHAKKIGKSTNTKPVKKSDRSTFSPNAQRLSDTRANADIVAVRLASVPEIRAEKIDEVRQKIDSGYYNSPEFVDKLAEKLAREFGA